jgi:thiol-disulfide isomerase/thioredoxin
MHQILIRASVAALMLVAAAGCSTVTSSANGKPDAKPAATRKAAPDFELKDVNGKTMKLSDFKGKVVLLNFWATWCGPCKIEIPWFIEFERTYKDKGFAVIGVALDEEGWEVVKPYIEARKVNYRVVLGTPQVEQLYGGVSSIPMTFILDREGRVASTHLGLVSKSEYVKDIQQLLD